MGLVLTGTNNAEMTKLIGREFHKPKMISKNDYTPFICIEGKDDLMVPVKKAMLRVTTTNSIYYFEYLDGNLSRGVLRSTTNPKMKDLVGKAFDLSGELKGRVVLPTANGDGYAMVTTVVDSQLVITSKHSVYDFRSA